MDKLKRHFLRVQEAFAAQKPFFEKKLDRWNKRGNFAVYKQAKLLYDELLQCEREIITVFESSDWKYNKAFLKVKIQSLESLFHELTSLCEAVWLKWAKATVVVLAIVFVLRNFVFGVYHVPTSSAETTLLVGDRVWGNKLVYLYEDPKPGDIVMFEDPTFTYTEQNVFRRMWQKYVGIDIPGLKLPKGPHHMAKRVIAVPGDVIEGKIEDGRPVVYLNGKKLNEPYVNRYPLLALKKRVGFIDSEMIGSVKVPDFLRVKNKVVLYAYDPKKDFEEQPFYYIDYRGVLYDRKQGYMKTYKAGVPATSKTGKPIDVFGPLIIPKDKYWVMGDNRRNSVDSREWGPVDRKKITGRATFIIWSLDSEEPLWLFEFIKNPFRFAANLRWTRFFKKVERKKRLSLKKG